MHYKPGIALLILLFSATSLFGFQSQLVPPIGKIKLKNGTLLKTQILDIDLHHNVTIGLPDKQQVVIASDHIYKVKARGIRHYGSLPDQQGFTGSVSFGLLFGKSSERSGMRTGVAIDGVFGYRLTSLLGFGIGAGAEFVNDLITAPLYMRFDGQLLNTRVSPIYTMDIGGSFAWYNSNNFNRFDSVHGGWFLRPGVGVRFRNLTNSIYMLVSYQVQTLTYESSSEWRTDLTSVEKRTMKNLKYTIGIKF